MLSKAAPILFDTNFSTIDWEEDGLVRIELLLNSWGQCPDVPFPKTPIVVIKIIYENRKVSTVRRWLWGDANSQMQAQLGAFADRAKLRARYHGVEVVRLSPLGDVGLVDLVEWHNLFIVREYLGNKVSTNDIISFFEASTRSARPRDCR